MTFGEQAPIFMEWLTTRKRNPVKPATVRTYASHIKNHILPELNAVELASFNNGAMKVFVEKLVAKLGPKSVLDVVALTKDIVESAVNEDGDCLYPRKWNLDFIDMPSVGQQHQPIVTPAQMEAALAKGSRYRKFWAMLAGTGLRIGEALAVRYGAHEGLTSWIPSEGLIRVRTSFYMGKEQTVKTKAGERDIDLDPQLNALLGTVLPGQPMEGAGHFLFQNFKGCQMGPADLYTRFLAPLGIEGFHAFRRFRATRLRSMGAPEDLIRYWLGHSSSNITDRYSKLHENVELRRQWAFQVGLGFQLPKSMKGEFLNEARA